MTITVNIHNPLPAAVRADPATIRLPEASGGRVAGVTVFFRTLDDAYAWLADALGKVQLAKIEAANTQPPSASTALLPGYIDDYEPNADLDDDVRVTGAITPRDMPVQP